MAYTKISKPSAQAYTKVTHGFIPYDEPSLSYDDANTLYDGINPNMYTKIAKPSAQSYTKIPKPT